MYTRQVFINYLKIIDNIKLTKYIFKILTYIKYVQFHNVLILLLQFSEKYL